MENNSEEQNQPLINREVTESNEIKEKAFVPESRIKLQRLQSKIDDVKTEIQKVIIGQQQVIMETLFL